MVESLWNDEEAARFSAQEPGDLGLRVYTSRLLGRDKGLVLHGGGNTSVKIRRTNRFGEEEEILYVKGSGWDLETIEAAGFSPVRLIPAARLATLPRLSDPDMVNELRTAMTLASAPTPSVEAILHAVLPYKYVDHTHADAVVTITNSVDGEALVREAYGDSVVFIPYVMPGFDLARLCAERFPAEAGPRTVGMVLLNHGIFSFGGTARESYERMIELVGRAERLLERRGAWTLGHDSKAAAPADTRPDPGRHRPAAPGRLESGGFPHGPGEPPRRPQPRLCPPRGRRPRLPAGAGHSRPRHPHQEPADAGAGRRGVRRRLPRLFRGARAQRWRARRAEDDARSGAAGDPRSRAGAGHRRAVGEGRGDRGGDLPAHDGRDRARRAPGRLPGLAGARPVRHGVLGPRAGEAGQGGQAAGLRRRGGAGDRRRLRHRPRGGRGAAGPRRGGRGPGHRPENRGNARPPRLPGSRLRRDGGGGGRRGGGEDGRGVRRARPADLERGHLPRRPQDRRPPAARNGTG